MRITQVKITNFKGIASASFEPAKINLLVGHNGTVKTSTLQAVRYGLTGDYPAGAIKGGEEKATVELTLPGIGTLARSLSNDKNETRLNGSLTTQKSINQLFEQQTGASPATANLLTSSAVLSSLSGGELSAYFMDNNLLSVKVRLKELIEFCEFSEAAQTFLKNEFREKDISMAEIEHTWDEARARRKELKQQLKQAEIKAEDVGEAPDIDAESIEKELANLLKQQGELQALKASYTQTVARRQKMIEEIESKKASVGVLVDAPPEEDFNKIDIEIGSIESELANLRSVVASIIETGKTLRKILQELSLATCPISKHLVCTTDKTKVQGEMEGEIEKATKAYRLQNGRINVLLQRHQELVEKRKELERQKSQYEQQKLISEKINYLKSNLPDVPKSPDEKLIKQLATQIEDLNRKRVMVIRRLGAEEYQALSKELRQRVLVMDEIVKKFDPKRGIRQKVLSHSLRPLEDYFNKELKKLLPKYSVRLDGSNGFSIKVIKDGKEYDAKDFASAGEGCRLWFILMDLINALTPYRILVFDNTDSMDGRAMIAFLNMLQGVQERYDHIFVSMINYMDVEEMLDTISQIEGINVIRFSEGKEELQKAA